MSDFYKDNVNKLTRRSENALHVAQGDTVVRVAKLLRLKVPRILERDNNSSDPNLIDNTIKNLVKRIRAYLLMTTVQNKVLAAKELDVKIPGILLNSTTNQDDHLNKELT